jgi:hypothetical protein
MISDYKLLVLQYLVQCPNGEIYLNDLGEDFFDLIEDKLSIQILKKYYKLYRSLPSKVTAKQFLEEQIQITPDLTEGMSQSLRDNFEDIYLSIPDGDIRKIEDTIIVEIQQKSLQDTFMDYAAKRLSVNQVFEKVDKLSSLVKSVGVTAHEDGGFLVEDRYKHKDERIQGLPTFLEDLNDMTAAGGFYSPQLIIFLSGPKHFKTGIILKIALEFARGGAKVYYADNENGATSIRNRLKMALMNCELHELYESSVQEELDEILYKFGHFMRGDIFIDTYPAYSKSMTDVEARLTYLKEKNSWMPDIIIYDTIDKFIPSNVLDQKRDTRIRIQLVYDEAINLNKKLGTFAIAPSQVNRKAIGKKVFDMGDLAEDFGKAMNAHGVFAICATDTEIEEGFRRIVPVCQREGVRFKQGVECLIHVDEKIMEVKEVCKDEYNSDATDD